MKTKYFFLIFIAALSIKTQYSRAQERINEVYSEVFAQKLIRTAIENYPQEKIIQAGLTMARTNLITTKSNWFDGLSFSYTYNPNNTIDIVRPNFFNGYQVSVNFTVTSLFSKSANVKNAKENVKLAEYAIEQYHLTLSTQIRSLYIAYLQAQLSLNSQEKAYADAVNIHNLNQSKFDKGEIPYEQWIQAEAALVGAKTGLNAAMGAFMIAKFSLEESINKKLEEVK